ncbi:DMT family transporter [Paenibacillus xerothermodurans]|uniref:DMT family transporter n=1 Tax=Paenibacillus xerothermodurans TaxID=1977292 RepID=A0A2W1N9X9_PAEXE|nr:DMT family transporter [Paenibacillus xerothermodurans]PZE20734.1 DMT family transporter [Paenibacillus xerothermodurans]
MSEFSRIRSLVLVTFLVLVWGISWPIYKIALDYTPPVLFAGMRTFFGGALLALLLLPRRQHLRWKHNWHIYVISSLFNVIMFYGLQTVGLMLTPSGLFSVIVYLQPVLVGVLAWAWLKEQMTAVKVVGLIIGFLGVAVVSAGGFTGHIALLGIVLAILTAVGWAVGTVYVKKVSLHVDSMWLVSVQCLIGGAVLSAAGSFTENWSDIVWNIPYLTGLIFGITLGISLSWIVYFMLVNAGDASRVASYTFLVPVISVLSGTLILGESFTFNLLVGLMFIGVSIYLVNRKPKLAVARETAA